METIIKRNNIEFPKFAGVKCNMMPIVQGDSSTLPDWCKQYSDFVEQNTLEPGEIGYLTIDESFVEANTSQRGFSRLGAQRNVHVEVGWGQEKYLCWGSPSPLWGGGYSVTLDPTTRVLIANSVSDTCQVWDTEEKRHTDDGDLGHYLGWYPAESGTSLKQNELYELGILTPHECVPQEKAGLRQFVRLIGSGVTGRESYFTQNPNLPL